jgi:electron transport complex protein RnfG
MSDVQPTADQPMQPAPPSLRMLMILGGISMLAGLLVVTAVQFTAPFIAENERIAIEKAIFHVVPGATSRRDFLLGPHGLEAADGDNGTGERIYAGYDERGRLRGIALKAEATGYQDVIRILYGYDPECQCVIGIRVLKMAETPGLGDKIAFDPAFLRNFDALEARLNAAGDALANAIHAVKHGNKTHPWQIDAISGATISSAAIGRMINASGQRMFPLIQRHLAELEARGAAADTASLTGTGDN